MKKRLIFAFILSTVLSLVVGLLSNLVAAYVAPALENRSWLVYGALILVFIIALPVSVYLFTNAFPVDNSSTGNTTSPDSALQPPSVTSQAFLNRLPIKPYRELLGRDTSVSEIIAALRDQSGRWVVAIDGMGGIGKTALAREMADRALSESLFERVVWEQASKASSGSTMGLTFSMILDSIARQVGALSLLRLKGREKEDKVREILQTRRILVILDNLETAKDSQNEIVSQLRPLLGPSKALLTSRHRFVSDVFAIHLIGLDEDNAIRLIRQEAQEKNIGRIAKAKPAELKQIARATGGSPLALKLVVGQLHHLELDTILIQLNLIQFPQNELGEDDYIKFYKSIFIPSWNLLTEHSRKLLVSMANFPAGVGGTSEALKEVSDLSDDLLTHSIDELWRLSFLEVGDTPTLNKTRYYLHALTQNFVLADIVKDLE